MTVLSPFDNQLLPLTVHDLYIFGLCFVCSARVIEPQRSMIIVVLLRAYENLRQPSRHLTSLIHGFIEDGLFEWFRVEAL